MKQGHVYKRYKTADGKSVTLRELRPDDLDAILTFINALVREKKQDPGSDLYTGFDRRITRNEEARWLSENLAATRKKEIINVIAEVDKKIIANGAVTRGHYKDTHHYGHLGLTMIREYRGKGIGRKMIETLARESHRAGLRTIDAEFLAENKSARKAYEKAGFKQAGLIPNKVYRNGRYFDGLIMARKL